MENNGLDKNTFRFTASEDSDWFQYELRRLRELDANRNHGIVKILLDILENRLLYYEEKALSSNQEAEAFRWISGANALRDALDTMDSELYWRGAEEDRRRRVARRRSVDKDHQNIRSAGHERLMASLMARTET